MQIITAIIAFFQAFQKTIDLVQQHEDRLKAAEATLVIHGAKLKDAN